MNHAPRIDRATRSIKGLSTWVTSKRGLSIILLNAILVGAVTLSTLWLWNGLSTAKLCMRLQCPPSFTGVRPPEYPHRDPLYTPDRFAGIMPLKSASGIRPSPPSYRRERTAVYYGDPFWTFYIDNHRFRRHRLEQAESEETISQLDILTLGDSFTFGEEVNSQATWPAYLERALGRKVYNAGTPGSGTAQAITRGHIASQSLKVDTVILSVLVGPDLQRDRRISYSHYWRRPVVNRDGVIMHLPSYKPKRGSKRSTPHPSAPNIWTIMDYAIQRFKQIPARKHILVLQHGSPNVLEKQEISLWLEKAKAMNIPVVDASITPKKARNAHWTHTHTADIRIPPSSGGHLTSYGNEIVAQAILDSGVLD